MNHKIELEIQACLDGELSASEASRVADMVRHDPDAGSLHRALAATRTLLSENEPQYTLDESREFYWSKIERGIRQETQDSEKPDRSVWSWRNGWVRFATSLAVVAVVGLVVVSGMRTDWLNAGFSDAKEVESPLEDFSAISFHSESANMTVVWVQSRAGTN